ncbi:MAG: histidine phosphatase family protein [Alphaproteobacteria bacterium]|nr:histidine phosphatase family protein [Alphaproteobacteria bacterium]
MEAPAVTRWWWLRHAPAAAPAAMILGRGDVAADLAADAAALDAVARLLPSDAAWQTTTLRRARETAAALRARIAGVPPAATVAAFDEQDFGAWTARTHGEIGAREAAVAEAFWRAPATATPPGGESFAAMIGRVGPAIASLCAAHAGRDVVVVAHAGTVRAALAVALDLAPERAIGLVVDPLSLTRLDHVATADPADRWGGPTGVWRVVRANVRAVS